MLLYYILVCLDGQMYLVFKIFLTRLLPTNGLGIENKRTIVIDFYSKRFTQNPITLLGDMGTIRFKGLLTRSSVIQFGNPKPLNVFRLSDACSVLSLSFLYLDAVFGCDRGPSNRFDESCERLFVELTSI